MRKWSWKSLKNYCSGWDLNPRCRSWLSRALSQCRHAVARLNNCIKMSTVPSDCAELLIKVIWDVTNSIWELVEMYFYWPPGAPFPFDSLSWFILNGNHFSDYWSIVLNELELVLGIKLKLNHLPSEITRLCSYFLLKVKVIPQDLDTGLENKVESSGSAKTIKISWRLTYLLF